MVQPSFLSNAGISVRVFNGQTNNVNLNISNRFSIGSAFYFCAPDIAEEIEFDAAVNMVITDTNFRRIPLGHEFYDTETIYAIPYEYQNLDLPMEIVFSMSENINFEVWVLIPRDPCEKEINENQSISEFIISLVATGVTGAAQVLVPNPLGALLATTLIRGVATQILNATNTRRSFRVFNPAGNPEVTLQLDGNNTYALPPGQTYSNNDWDGAVLAFPGAGAQLETPIQVYDYLNAP